jgi:hypothetical protein
MKWEIGGSTDKQSEWKKGSRKAFFSRPRSKWSFISTRMEEEKVTWKMFLEAKEKFFAEQKKCINSRDFLLVWRALGLRGRKEPSRRKAKQQNHKSQFEKFHLLLEW